MRGREGLIKDLLQDRQWERYTEVDDVGPFQSLMVMEERRA